MKNDVEKLGACIVGGDEEDRFWQLVNRMVENRSKINELIDLTNQRTVERDSQVKSLGKQIHWLHKEIDKLKKRLEILK